MIIQKEGKAKTELKESKNEQHRRIHNCTLNVTRIFYMYD